MLGEKIKLLRKKMMMTQCQFAKELGYGQAIVSCYELDTKRPPYDILVKLDELAKKNKIRIRFLH